MAGIDDEAGGGNDKVTVLPIASAWRNPFQLTRKPSQLSQLSVESSRSKQSGSFSLQRFFKEAEDQSEMSGSSGGRQESMKNKLFKMGTSIFLDASEMKAKVRETLTQPVYNVTDYYNESGCWQAVARSSLFEKVSLFVTGLNSLWIWVDTDLNKSEVLLKAPVGFQIVEHLFTAFFVGELIIRMCAFRRKRDGFRDRWILFDIVLVSLMVVETWILTLALFIASSSSSGTGWLSNTSVLRLARMLRLSRMARMAKLLKATPELMILIKGMIAAMRSVFFTLCLLLVIMYVFAIAFTQLSVDYDLHRHYFDTVISSMYTLLVRGALLDNVSILLGEIKSQSVGLAIFFIFFVLLSALTVLNMLIGVLVHVVSSVASIEREEQMLAFVKVKMETLTKQIDTDDDNQISRDEFAQIVTNLEAIKCLLEIGVDPVGLVDQVDFIFADPVSGEDRANLSFSEFMEVILELRGRNTATVKDIIDMRKFILQSFERMESKLERRLTRSLTRSSIGTGRNSTELKSALRQSQSGRDSVRFQSEDSMKSQSCMRFHSECSSKPETIMKSESDPRSESPRDHSPRWELQEIASKLQPTSTQVAEFVTKFEETLGNNLKELQRILNSIDVHGSTDAYADDIVQTKLYNPAKHQLTCRSAATRSGASIGLKARSKNNLDAPSMQNDSWGRCRKLLTSLSSELNVFHSICHDLRLHASDDQGNGSEPPASEGLPKSTPMQFQE